MRLHLQHYAARRLANRTNSVRSSSVCVGSGGGPAAEDAALQLIVLKTVVTAQVGEYSNILGMHRFT